MVGIFLSPKTLQSLGESTSLLFQIEKHHFGTFLGDWTRSSKEDRFIVNGVEITRSVTPEENQAKFQEEKEAACLAWEKLWVASLGEDKIVEIFQLAKDPSNPEALQSQLIENCNTIAAQQFTFLANAIANELLGPEIFSLPPGLKEINPLLMTAAATVRCTSFETQEGQVKVINDYSAYAVCYTGDDLESPFSIQKGDFLLLKDNQPVVMSPQKLSEAGGTPGIIQLGYSPFVSIRTTYEVSDVQRADLKTDLKSTILIPHFSVLLTHMGPGFSQQCELLDKARNAVDQSLQPYLANLNWGELLDVLREHIAQYGHDSVQAVAATHLAQKIYQTHDPIKHKDALQAVSKFMELLATPSLSVQRGTNKISPLTVISDWFTVSPSIAGRDSPDSGYGTDSPSGSDSPKPVTFRPISQPVTSDTKGPQESKANLNPAPASDPNGKKGPK